MRPLLIANWKMNLTTEASLAVVERLHSLLPDHPKTEIILCPSFLSIPVLAGVYPQDKKWSYGAQNISSEETGPYTGEVSAEMITPWCQYVIVGHSERRQYFHETDEEIAKKFLTALQHDLHPVACVGENRADRAADRTDEVILGQLTSLFEGVPHDLARKAVIAYEPLWAISTSRDPLVPTTVQIQTVFQLIHETLVTWYGDQHGIRMIYGGSVNIEFLKNLAALPIGGGALVGAASLDPERFAELVRIYEEKI